VVLQSFCSFFAVFSLFRSVFAVFSQPFSASFRFVFCGISLIFGDFLAKFRGAQVATGAVRAGDAR
jgi:hypothetical protein